MIACEAIRCNTPSDDWWYPHLFFRQTVHAFWIFYALSIRFAENCGEAGFLKITFSWQRTSTFRARTGRALRCFHLRFVSLCSQCASVNVHQFVRCTRARVFGCMCLCAAESNLSMYTSKCAAKMNSLNLGFISKNLTQ